MKKRCSYTGTDEHDFTWKVNGNTVCPCGLFASKQVNRDVNEK